MSQLSIYKASAGSGKTFQLAREYLKLIFKPGERFSSVLGVTFTNKATAEMRNRILDELYKLAKGAPSDHEKEIAATYNFTSDEVKNKASQLLNQILHNYSRFNISTIDSFFQRILKAFTREVGLNSGFNVELNHRQVLEEVIARFFDELTPDNPINDWLSQFSIKKMEEGKSWDIQYDLLNFSSEAFGEAFYAIDEEELNRYGNINEFIEYRKQLDKITEKFASVLIEAGKKGLSVIKNHGLTVDDFTQKKKGVGGFFLNLSETNTLGIKEPNSYVMKAYHAEDVTEGWCSKKAANKAEVEACVQSGLKDLLQQIIVHFQENYETYATASSIRSNLDVFAMIAEIFNRVNAYCNEKNIFLLPLASPLLAKIIGKDDAPFIYEKSGEFLSHFMIDEFQDTSNLQWQNFFPLVQNGLSQGNYSLVVGDVKQSIYRWRNSDWTLLESKLANQLKQFVTKEINLPYNWRSDKNIVKFNNWVFANITPISALGLDESLVNNEKMASELSRIDSIYKQAEQQIPENRKTEDGYVKIEFTERQPANEETQEITLDKIIDTILALNKKGYQPRDIAILVRQNKEGAMVARHLMNYRQKHPKQEAIFQFVSSDSVFLASSPLVQLLVSVIQFFVDQSDKLIRGQIVQLYLSIKENEQTAFNALIENDITDTEQFLGLLPPAFGNEVEQIKQLPLSDMVNALMRIFVFDTLNESAKSEKAFINAFQDMVTNYTQKKGSDLTGFTQWWQEYGLTTPVNLSEEQNAIQILTIHKSKGLEYKALLIPFAQWNTDQRPSLIWCKTQAPFDKFSRVPVIYSSKLSATQFKEDYASERILSLVDNINLLYVAFTRAKKALFIFAPEPGKNLTHKNISDVLWSLMETSSNKRPEEIVWNADEKVAEMGQLEELPPSSEEEAVTDDDDLEIAQKPNIKISLHATDFFKEVTEGTISSMNRGKILHELLEKIITREDTYKAIKKLQLQGLISVADSEKLKHYLEKLFDQSPFNEWFSGKFKVKTESSYLLSDKSIKRPDRVMFGQDKIVVIDYKFTQKEAGAHLKQVKSYIDEIAEIEKLPLEGYVWYVLKGKLLKV